MFKRFFHVVPTCRDMSAKFPAKPLPSPAIAHSPTSSSLSLPHRAPPAPPAVCPQQGRAAVLPLTPPMHLPRTPRMTKNTADERPWHKWGILAASVRSIGPSHSAIPASLSSLMFKILLLMRNILNITSKKDLMRRCCRCRRFCRNRCHNCRRCI